MKDLEYLERLSQDLIANLEEQEKLMPKEDVLVNIIYSNVRETLLSQVLEYKESNPGLSNYLEALTKKILDSVSLSSKLYKTEKIKISGKIEILKSILDQTVNKRNKQLSEQSRLQSFDLDEEVAGAKKRKEKNIRKTGERPKNVKENRKISWKYSRQQT